MLEHQKSLTTQIKTQRKKGMQKMKKYLLALLLLTSVFAVAAETEFVQFTRDAFNTYGTYQDWNPETGTTKGWTDSHMITLSVKGGSTVYMSYLITNFHLQYI